jgi:hypothetical protein
MKNFNIFIWSSDFEEFTGEGLLARSFVENLFATKNKIKIVSNNSVFFYNKKILIKKKKKYKNNFINKYLFPYYGILLIWYYYLKNKKTVYINYLPLWNFIIFLLLPRDTLLGPITGNLYKAKVNSLNSFIRKIIFPLFYFISIKIIFKKYKNIVFSTDNLKELVYTKLKKFCLFNICLLFYKKRKIVKKNIDFLFYFRKHASKNNQFLEFIIKQLADRGFKIVVVGDKFNYKKIKNYTNIPRVKLLPLLDQTRYSVSVGDNLYSLFFLDCLSCNVILFYNKHLKFKNNFFLDFPLIPLNFNDFEISLKIIILKYKNFYFEKINKISLQKIYSFQNKIKLTIKKIHY